MWQASQVTYPGERTADVPIKDVCLRLGFKNHQTWLKNELDKLEIK